MKDMRRRSVVVTLALGSFLCWVCYRASSKAESLFEHSEGLTATQFARLFEFVSTKKLRPSASSVSSAGITEQEIAINFDKLDFEQAQNLTFSLFDGLSYKAIRRPSEGFIRFAPDEFSWRGKISHA